MKYTIKEGKDNWQLWIRVNDQYSQVFEFTTKVFAEIAKEEAIAADKERMAGITNINDYFKIEAK
jgi:hypothetical protein